MRQSPSWALIAVALAPLLACSSADDPPPPEDTEPDAPQVAYLSPALHLARASMALRGTRPTEADLARVIADETALPAIVDEYLASPAFGETMRNLHNEALLLRTDYFYYPAGFPAVDTLAGEDTYYLNRSVQEAPLRLIEHVITTDRPYSEIVTADYTVTNRVGATVWQDLPYDASGPEWQVSRWEDGRENAGILSDSWIFSRFMSTPSNANRGRANAISTALLCYDFLSRDIEVGASVNLADPDEVKNAVVDNAACASCHQALDPLASFFKDFFPIFVPQEIVTYPFESFYFPGVFETYLGVEFRPKSYFGQAGAGLRDLGRMISEDPRFSLCATKRFYAYFNQVELDDVPLQKAAELQHAFLDGGMSAKALARAIVLSDDFRVSHAESETGADEVVGMRRARPDQLAMMFEDVTGFRWDTDLRDFDLGMVDLSRDSFLGYQVIGGGTDAMYVTRPTLTDNATTSLYLRALAAEAAGFVVQTDFALADPTQRRLLTAVEADTTDADAVRAQLVALHRRIFSEWVEVDDEEVTESYQLWSAVLAHSGDPARAWEATLTAMLQDLRVAYH